ncbi:MAG: four helix bundle protein [Acidobacteriota bacterium]|nr:four helix bundle protein [Acidobacteriota bacterium]
MEKRRPVRSFEDLMVWQMGIALVKRIYVLTASGLLNRDFGLRDQFRRASVSIPTNIAEGFERSSRKEYLFFLNIAKGSAGELRSLLRVGLEVGYLDLATYESLREEATKLSAYLFNHRKSIKAAEPFGR